MRRRLLAPGKVNLCLLLGGPRADGRHELVTVFESLSLADELELEVLSTGEEDCVVCPGVSGPNLAREALRRLRAAGWQAPPVRVTITKRVPVAGGMGGGSADAAAVLRAAQEIGEVDPAVLPQIAASLGADVPAQLQPGLWLGTGAGEVVEPLPPLPPHAIVIVALPHALATPEVYREADRLRLPREEEELAALEGRLRAALGCGELPPELMVNDLGPAAVSLCPPVAEALAALAACGADVPLVSGSGPTVAGVFWGAEAEGRAQAAMGELRGHRLDALVARPLREGGAGPTGL